MTRKPGTELIQDAAEALACLSTLAEIRGPSRKRAILWDRHLVVALLHDVEALSYPDLGALFGRDHTTMMNSVEQAKAIVQRHRAFAARWTGAAARYRSLRDARAAAARVTCPECGGAGTVDRDRLAAIEGSDSDASSPATVPETNL